MRGNYKIEGCFMDDDHRFAFIHIYKNASISRRNALGIRGKYHKFEDVKKYNPITLCIIRNPLSRFISAYQYLLRLEDNGFPDQHPTHITKETEFYKHRQDPEKSFLLFLEYIEENGFYDAVTLPQVEFLKDRGLTIDDIDEVFIQLRIKEDFEKFREKYNIEGEFPADNIGDEEIGRTLTGLIWGDDKIANRIKELYREDFDMFMSFEKKRWN